MLVVKPAIRRSVAAPSNRFFNDFFERTNTFTPAINTVETEQGFRLEIAVPGLEKSDFQVKVDQEMLTISVNKEYQTAEGETVRRREFGHYEFERSFRLPDTIDQDKIDASYQNGILVITLPQKPEASPKTIEIK